MWVMGPVKLSQLQTTSPQGSIFWRVLQHHSMKANQRRKSSISHPRSRFLCFGVQAPAWPKGPPLPQARTAARTSLDTAWRPRRARNTAYVRNDPADLPDGTCCSFSAPALKQLWNSTSAAQGFDGALQQVPEDL